MKYCAIFRKKNEDSTRYWMSISEKGFKDGKETDGWNNTTIPVRMSEKAAEYFADHCEKTKTDGIKMGTFDLEEFWFKVGIGKDENFPVLFINKMKKSAEKD